MQVFWKAEFIYQTQTRLSLLNTATVELSKKSRRKELHSDSASIYIKGLIYELVTSPTVIASHTKIVSICKIWYGLWLQCFRSSASDGCFSIWCVQVHVSAIVCFPHPGHFLFHLGQRYTGNQIPWQARNMKVENMARSDNEHSWCLHFALFENKL